MKIMFFTYTYKYIMTTCMFEIYDKQQQKSSDAIDD